MRIDTKSGVPFYRQIIEQVKFAIARGDLQPGDQLPTVRQLAVDLSINPNTVIRAYRELEIGAMLETHQGSGTFVGKAKPRIDDIERQRMLDQILTDLLARATGYGFSLHDVLEGLRRRDRIILGTAEAEIAEKFAKASMIIVPSTATEE